MTTTPRPLSWRKRVAFTLLTVVGLLLIVEVLAQCCCVAVAWVAPTWAMPRTRTILADQSVRIRALLARQASGREHLDPVLGWHYRPGLRSATDSITEQGVRGRCLYASVPPPGVTRVAAFGDSFVYGNEVTDTECWAARVEALYPELEVLNYGVGGYGFDQEYLRYRIEGNQLAPRIILIGFFSSQLEREVNVYRRFLSIVELPLTKPRFRLGAAGGLELLPNPVGTPEQLRVYLDDPWAIRELGKHDGLYRRWIYENPCYDWLASVRVGQKLADELGRRWLDPQRLKRHGVFNPASEAFRILTALAARFTAEVSADGRLPVVVLFPGKAELAAVRSGRPPAYEPFKAFLKGQGIAHLDLVAAFQDEPPDAPLDAWFAAGGHYSPAGNLVVARWLGPKLLELDRPAGGRPDDLTSRHP